MSQQLRESERKFLRLYMEWLNTVEEGLMSVSSFYREGHTDSGDRLLAQMMEGFVPFDASNMTMKYIFGREEKNEEELNRFQEVVEKASAIEELNEEGERFRFLTKEIIPAFQRWKLIVWQVAGK
ncbi:hypothetical protein [Bacillus sp. FJAT-44742]|uniref:hypothetical protein n=1 Tax=Bacillus sp. FJAT-44742 TaxID=2014005 RepID=UPI000C240804|nr:hypothetical protein [Bacillus sp. FJAT-44742]